MGGGSKSQTVGYKYYLGMHMALCHGPIDYLLALLADKKVAWGGQQAVNGTLTIAAEGLFGGEDREGGVSGSLDFEMGALSQGVNSYLAANQGGDVPAYRGIVGLVMRKMYLGMNPYLKPWSAVAQRVFTRQTGIPQWYITKAGISNPSAQSVGYSPRFEEQFTTMAPYTVVSGNGGLFGVSGGTMMIGTQNSGTVARIIRDIPETTFSKLTMKVQLPLVGAATDDAGIIEFMNNGSVVFTVNPMREQAFDSQRRPRFYYNGSDNFMGTALTPATWYRFVWEMNVDTGAWTASFIRDSDGAVHATASGSGVTEATCDQIRFTVDSGGQTVTVQYREVVLYSTGGVGVDMNPAHIIRECLTDPDWGMGYDEADIDDDSFMAAADTLYTEGMGMSLLWDRQIPIEDFIKEVLKHIDGTVFVSRTTGKFILKLIRNDYDENDLLVLDESNIEKVENYSERRFDEMVNSVTVKYTDAATWNDASVEIQDVAQVHMQNAVINTTVTYTGFTYAAIASKAGARDLKTLSTPLATATLYANTDAQVLNIGDVFKFNWPDYQVQDLIMRVTAISFGDGKDHTVKISCTQDSFALPPTEYVVTDPGEWTDPSGPPEPVAAQLFFEVPYYEIVRFGGQTAVDNQMADTPDLGYVGAAAVAPDAGAINAELFTDAGAGYESAGTTMDFCPSATIVDAIGFMTTSVSLENQRDTDSIVPGKHAQIGDELIVVDSFDGTTLTFKRGALDTVPAEHAAGSRIYFWASNDSFGYDPTEYTDGESIDAVVLPITGQGQLSIGEATVGTVVMAQRALRPYPPGNVKINDEYYPALAEDSIVITWAHRDRLQQTGGTLLDFTSASVGPESGTTYNLRLVDASNDEVIAQQLNVVGTTATFNISFSGLVILELESVRDSVVSLQRYEIQLDFVGGDILLTESDGGLLTENTEAIALDRQFSDVYLENYIYDGTRFLAANQDYVSPTSLTRFYGSTDNGETFEYMGTFNGSNMFSKHEPGMAKGDNGYASFPKYYALLGSAGPYYSAAVDTFEQSYPPQPWSSATISGAKPLCLAWDDANSRFVRITDAKTLESSTDGLTWSNVGSLSLPPFSWTWYTGMWMEIFKLGSYWYAFHGGKGYQFQADAVLLMRSTDLLNWTLCPGSGFYSSPPGVPGWQFYRPYGVAARGTTIILTAMARRSSPAGADMQEIVLRSSDGFNFELVREVAMIAGAGGGMNDFSEVKPFGATGFVAAGAGGILVSTDDGLTWSRTAMSPVPTALRADGTNVVANRTTRSDGANECWFTDDGVTWVKSNVRNYRTGTFQHWRVRATIVTGDVRFGELAFYDGATKHVGYTSSQGAGTGLANVDDGDSATYWTATAANIASGDAWVAFDMGSTVAVTAIELKSPTGSNVAFMPLALEVEASSDGTSWLPVWFESGLVWTTDENKRMEKV